MNAWQQRGGWPTLRGLEDAAEGVKQEVDVLMEQARAELRRRQDLEGEAPDADADVAYNVALHTCAHRLRSVARQLSRAQAELVPPSDERYTAARRVIGWLDEAQQADAPWQPVEVEPAA